MPPIRPNPFEDPAGHRLSMQLPGNGGVKQEGPKMVWPLHHPTIHNQMVWLSALLFSSVSGDTEVQEEV